MLDFLTFVLNNITATPARKLAVKAAFARQRRWTATVLDEDGEEVANSVTFKAMFNAAVWGFIREECVAGQRKIRRAQATADDTFGDLV